MPLWLLSTNRAELHPFSSLDAVPGGYAILSHTWIELEQSFEETQALRERCKDTGENPRELSSQKIRECCELAESHGHRWLWVDTSCINKASSADLSEGINSMLHLYEQSEVCYVYLADVEDDCVVDAPRSAFRTARWHGRGWTLQELIAPTIVMFISKGWKIIGNKMELAPLLEEVTGISQQVLTNEVHYSEVSVAERMSWGSNRMTTRLEDEAYCLMGLFDVHMPAIYGEGIGAFKRLLREIITKHPLDGSLFAWGPCITASDNVTPMGLPEVYQSFTMSYHAHIYVLAESPKCFIKPFGRTVHYTPSATHPLQRYPHQQPKMNLEEPPVAAPEENVRGPFGRMELPKISLTGYGLECRFPVIESDGFVVAVLLCDTGHEHLGLLLHPSNNLVQDPSRKAYHTGYGFRLPSGPPVLARLISLGNDFYNLRLNGKAVTAEWRDIVIADSPPPAKKNSALSRCSSLHSITPAPPFRLPPWLISKLTRIGMELHPLHVESKPVDGKPLLVSALFEDTSLREGIFLVLGTCMRSPDCPEHWAKAASWHFPYLAPAEVDFMHDCDTDHVLTWSRWEKDFGDDDRTIRLSFSRCQLTPAHTLVIHIELKGDVYDTIKRHKHVAFPSRENSTLIIGMEVVGSSTPLPPAKEQVSFSTSGSQPLRSPAPS